MNMGIWIFLTCLAILFALWGIYENNRQEKLKGNDEGKK